MKKNVLPTLILLLGLLLASPAAAKSHPPAGGNGGPGGPGGPPPAGGHEMGPPPEMVLKEALSLTETQVLAFKTLMDTRTQTVQSVMPQLDAAQRALDDAMQGASPDPAQLGALLLTVHGLRVQVHQADLAVSTGFRALLTADQQSALDGFMAAEPSLPVLMALQRLHI